MKREMVLLPALIGGLLTMTGRPPPRQQLLRGPRRDGEIARRASSRRTRPPSAMINGSAVIEVFVSENGSWTILATGTDGKSCVLSAGEGCEINVAALGEGA